MASISFEVREMSARNARSSDSYDGSPAESSAASVFESHSHMTLLAVFLLLILAAEVGLRFLVRRDVIPYRTFPTTPAPEFWDDIDPDFGVWHLPSAVFRHRTPCFDVVYSANRYGARDRDRTVSSGERHRTVVLGDSFVEGYGVSDRERFTNVLENRTGIEHLNFGTAGGFGSIQEWLLYKNLASQFDHSRVLVFLLPSNDFIENDAERSPPTRYRPYLTRSGDRFEVVYPVQFEERSREKRNLPLRVWNRVTNGSYTVNFFRVAIPRLQTKLGQSLGPSMPSYEDYDQSDLEVLFFTYREIAAEAAGRPVHVFVIPRTLDLQRAESKGHPFGLLPDLGAFAETVPNLQVVDLVPYFLEYAQTEHVGFDAFVHTCDGHWSALGHRVAADAIQAALY
jgi:hypothetical protein